MEQDKGRTVIDKLEAVQKSKTYEIVLNQIRNLIMSGDILPGEKLPSERELSRRLDVSRASVRIALKLLEFMGLLEVRPGSGVFIVRDQPNQSLKGELEQLKISQQHPLWDLIEARKDIEPYMAGVAAQRAQQKDVDSMTKILDDMELSINRETDWIEKANSFHLSIAMATHNIILYKIGLVLQDLMNESKVVSLREKKRAFLSLKEHRSILKAIQAHDPKEARKHMIIHLGKVEDLLSRSGIGPS